MEGCDSVYGCSSAIYKGLDAGSKGWKASIQYIDVPMLFRMAWMQEGKDGRL